MFGNWKPPKLNPRPTWPWPAPAKSADAEQADKMLALAVKYSEAIDNLAEARQEANAFRHVLNVALYQTHGKGHPLENHWTAQACNALSKYPPTHDTKETK